MTHQSVVDQMVIAHVGDQGLYLLMGIPSASFWLDPSLNRMLAPLADEVGFDLFRLSIASSSAMGTERDYQAMVTEFADNFPDGFLAWGRAVGSIGWGRFELPAIDEQAHTARVVVRNTWELEMQRHNERRWGCPFIQGKLIGLFSAAFGEPCWATEVEIHYDPDDQYVAYEIAPSTRTIDAELAALRAVQHRRRAEEHLRVEAMRLERDQAQRANEAKSAFLAAMSHELRTPLNAILGYTELCRDLLIDDGQDAIAEDLDRVLEAGNHLLDLVSQVLEMSRVEAGELDLRIEPVALGPFMDGIVRLVRPLANKGRNRFEVLRSVGGDGDLGVVSTDRTRLTQILVNILGNAFKFTEDGVVRLEIRRTSRHLELTVVDTGIGIPKERQASIFESFTQADRSIQHRFGGTGLGLAIAYQLTHALGGELQVESEVGRGSTFCIQLPL